MIMINIMSIRSTSSKKEKFKFKNITNLKRLDGWISTSDKQHSTVILYYNFYKSLHGYEKRFLAKLI